jgi:type IV pilus assembly protein PilO
MTLQINDKEKKILIFSTLIIILMFTLVYFNYIQPLMTEVDSKQRELNSAQQLYDAVLNQKDGIGEIIEENTEMLQKRLPVKPLIDQFILDLEKAEILSDSLILQMGFASSAGEEVTSALEAAANLNYSIGENSESEEGAAVSETLPSGIVKIPITLVIESPSYYHLEKFLQTLENLDRIVSVESINFSGQPEITELLATTENINYNVSLSVYYMPGLIDLEKELPKVETGEPANKKNPLSRFDDSLSETEIEEDQLPSSTEEENPSDSSDENDTPTSSTPQTGQEIIEYIVQSNDTLYSISMRFYQSRDGERIIKDYNQLDNDGVYPGQALKIPLPQ